MKACIGFVNTACVGLLDNCPSPVYPSPSTEDPPWWSSWVCWCRCGRERSGASTQTGSSYDSGGEVKGQTSTH